jgi:hypothetical protein
VFTSAFQVSYQRYAMALVGGFCNVQKICFLFSSLRIVVSRRRFNGKTCASSPPTLQHRRYISPTFKISFSWIYEYTSQKIHPEHITTNENQVFSQAPDPAFFYLI